MIQRCDVMTDQLQSVSHLMASGYELHKERESPTPQLIINTVYDAVSPAKVIYVISNQTVR